MLTAAIRRSFWFAALVCVLATDLIPLPRLSAEPPTGSRLAYLDERDPYYPHAQFPKLTTPMWVGEPGVEAVIHLSVDDMGRPSTDPRCTATYFAEFLRPLIDRLKRIDGRGPVSIFTCQARAGDPTLQQIIKDGVSLEGHGFSHPVPLLRAPADLSPRGNSLSLVRQDFLSCVDSLFEVANHRPVAFRIPGCDAANTNSPRYFAEIFPLHASRGFLECDSSIMTTLADEDESLPRKWRVDSEERPRFAKFVRDIPQTKRFFNYVVDYPYPYVIDGTIWEIPGVVPADSHGVHKYGANSPRTVEEWKRAVDVAVAKQGLLTLLFHTIGYITPQQLVEVIDYADLQYGRRVKFLNCREINDRLCRHLLDGQRLRGPEGNDNGIRLLDLDRDGFQDVVIANDAVQKTKVWNPKSGTWRQTMFPAKLVQHGSSGRTSVEGRFLSVGSDGGVGIAFASDATNGVWEFVESEWRATAPLPTMVDNLPLRTSEHGKDRGVRFRDVDGDGASELIVNNDVQNATFAYDRQEQRWSMAPFALPATGWIVDANGTDQGLRFVDLNADGRDDLVYSNEREFAVHLFSGARGGWKKIASGKAGTTEAPPAIVNNGSLQGVWFHSRQMVLVNEFTAANRDRVELRSFEQLAAGKTGLASKP